MTASMLRTRAGGGQERQGVRDPVILSRQALHARRLTFQNPQSGQEMTFEAPIPADMQRVVATLETF